MQSLRFALTNRYFIGAVLSMITTVAIAAAGNPFIGKGFYLHFIPEMVSFCFLGFWGSALRWKMRTILIWYGLTVIVAFFQLDLDYDMSTRLSTIPVLLMLGAPMPASFAIDRAFKKKKVVGGS